MPTTGCENRRNRKSGQPNSRSMQRAINIDRQNAIIKSYNKKREIEVLEKQMWSKVLRHAALRFWLSRLHDKYFPTAGEITHQHDPNKFKSILIDRIKKNYELKI